jgi:hypothetical protein
MKAVNACYFTSKLDGGLSIIKFKTIFKGYHAKGCYEVNYESLYCNYVAKWRSYHQFQVESGTCMIKNLLNCH